MDQIVFATMREPVAKRVVVDVAFDMVAKGFSAEEEAEEPNPEWSRKVSRVLDELDTKEKLRELVIFERLYGWAAIGLSLIDYGEILSKPFLICFKVIIIPLKRKRVKKLEGQLLGLSSQVEDLRSDLHQLVEVLKEAIAPNENHASSFKDECYITWGNLRFRQEFGSG